MTHTTSKQELFVTLVTTVNYCLKEIWTPLKISKKGSLEQFDL